MFNFGNKKFDELSKEVDRLNTIVTVMMKEISLLKKSNETKSSQSDEALIAHYEAMNSIYNAAATKPKTTAPSSKSSLKSYVSGRSADTGTNNNDVIIAATMNDTTPSKCSTYTTTYAGTSFPDYSSSHSHSSHSSSYDSSSSDCGSFD